MTDFKEKFNEGEQLQRETKCDDAGTPINNKEQPPTRLDHQSCLVPCLKDAKMEKTKWLLEGYLEEGALSIIAGRGGVGKGLFTEWLASLVTTGKALGDFPETTSKMGRVLFFSAEDNPGTKMLPCARAAGAAVDRIYYMTPGLYRKMTKGRTLEISSEMLGIIDLVKSDVVLLDPVQSWLPAGCSITSPKVRKILATLAEKAQEDGFSVIIVLHQNKTKAKDSRLALAGNNDLWNLARSVVAVGTVPGDEERFYVSPEKLNDAAPGDTMIFRKQGTEIDNGEGEIIRAVAAVFETFSDKRYVDFESEKSERSSQARAEVKAAIMLTLGRNKQDDVASTELQETVMRATDCSEISYIRARNELKTEGAIEKYKDGHGGWSWRIKALSRCA